MTTITNLIIQQGATFQRDITLTDADGQPLSVAGMTANGSIKRDYYANTTLADFEVSLTDGNLSLRMEANTTITLWPGDYVYDVVVSTGANLYRIAEGLATVDPGVTGVEI